MNNQPVGILLAAGSSQRFGSNKLLHPVIDNTPMLLSCAQKIAGVLPGSVVVINHELDSDIAQLEQLGLKVVINEQAEKGMGTSLALGISYAQDAPGWLIALADMPYIQSGTYKLLVNKLKEGAGIVAPVFEQRRGHPVGFNRVFKEELMSLQGDAGARHLIENHQAQLELLLTDDEGVVRDVDKPDDL
jgi:molybdenum cofactor cytidylyltransferase